METRQARGAGSGAWGRRAALPWSRSGCHIGQLRCARSPSCSVRVADGGGELAAPATRCYRLGPAHHALCGVSACSQSGAQWQNAATALQHRSAAAGVWGPSSPERRGWRAPGRTMKFPLPLTPPRPHSPVLLLGFAEESLSFPHPFWDQPHLPSPKVEMDASQLPVLWHEGADKVL